MKTISSIVAVAALCAAATIPALSFAANSGNQGPDVDQREHCRSDPDTCREQMTERAEAWIKKVDTNGDVRISRDEAKGNAPQLAQNFTQIDTDHDGAIERRAAHPAMRERYSGQGGEPEPQ
jgi:EF hand